MLSPLAAKFFGSGQRGSRPPPFGCLQPDLRALSRRTSRAASASSHSRNCVILGTADVAFGQTTQYVLDSLKATSIGLTSRTVDEIPSRKRGAGKRDALTIDGGIDQHARTVENRTRNDWSGDAGGVEPARPGLPVIEAQQRESQQIGRLGDAVASRKEPGTANGEKLFRAEPHDIEAGPIAITMPNRKADILARELDMIHR